MQEQIQSPPIAPARPRCGRYVAVQRLRRICNPFRPIWDTPDDDADRLALHQVRRCIARREYEVCPYNPKDLEDLWTMQRHAQRVAYLAVYGWHDPVSIDVGVPSLGCTLEWPLIDGNHRLAAAIVRADRFIRAEVCGSVAFARRLLG